MSENYYQTSDGEDLTQDANGDYDAGGGDFEPIPAKTQVLAAPDEVKWDVIRQQDGSVEEYISVRWVVFKPEAYKNRKIFQKIRVENEDDKKCDKAKRMLAAIDTNAGGRLLKLGRKPSDADLATALISKMMMLMLQVWKSKDQDGNPKSGNWVSAVAPKGSGKPTTGAKKESAPQSGGDDFDDDIPF